MADALPTAAERLRARLDELGWSQTDLAKAIDVSTTVVSRWLSGDRVPSLDMAFRIQRSEVGLLADIWVTHAAREPVSSPELVAADVEDASGATHETSTDKTGTDSG